MFFFHIRNRYAVLRIGYANYTTFYRFILFASFLLGTLRPCPAFFEKTVFSKASSVCTTRFFINLNEITRY